MKIHITRLPQQTITAMQKDGLTAPNRCYSNAAKIVLSGMAGDAKYVLCWVKDSAGGVHGHAIFAAEEHYFDPTLQANSGISTSYELVKTYTKAELVALMEENHGPRFLADGFVPPALLPNGQVACQEVQN